MIQALNIVNNLNQPLIILIMLIIFGLIALILVESGLRVVPMSRNHKHKIKFFESKFLRIGFKNENFKTLGDFLQFKNLVLTSLAPEIICTKVGWTRKSFLKL